MNGDPQVRFLVDYRGVLTGERFFSAGDVVAIAPLYARDLVYAGRAEYIEGDQNVTRAADLEKLSLDELKELAKEADVPSYWLMKKETLIEALRDD